MIEYLNNERKKATRLSLIVIILVILLGLASTLLSKIHFLFTILTLLILVAGLYFFSKLVIIPKYDVIKGKIISNSLKTNNVKVSKIKSFVSLVNVFFDVLDTSYTNPFRFEKNNLVMDVEDLVVTKKEKRKAPVRLFHGKIIQIKLDNYFSKEILAILDNTSDSKMFIDKAKTHFKNASFSSKLTASGKYFTNVIDKNDLRKLGLLLPSNSLFNLILYKNNILTIFIKQKEEPFEFNLKNNIDNSIINNAKKCYNDIDRVFTTLKGESYNETTD